MARISYNDNINIVNGIIQLKKEFNRRSGGQAFHHVQVYHHNGWFIYQLSKYIYEVFKEITTNKLNYTENKISKTNIKKVKYPNDEDFGKWAWSVTSYESALKIINIEK